MNALASEAGTATLIEPLLESAPFVVVRAPNITYCGSGWREARLTYAHGRMIRDQTRFGCKALVEVTKFFLRKSIYPQISASYTRSSAQSIAQFVVNRWS